MQAEHPSFRLPVWLAVNLLLIGAACALWGGLDYLYVARGWPVGTMQRINDGFVLGVPALAMLVNLWLLRRRPAAGHLLGALGSALAVAGGWWLAVAVFAERFHIAVGGVPGG